MLYALLDKSLSKSHNTNKEKAASDAITDEDIYKKIIDEIKYKEKQEIIEFKRLLV